MCGIAGYLHFDKDQPASNDRLKRMTDVIAHRGPDAEGRFVNNNIALGHRRLAIIDLQTGQQPMQYSDNSLTITYNGEIYNYIELREELKKKGYHFRTDSDTEVLLAAYKEWDTECVQRFNGMWAFALWDESRRRLFCSRDRIGEKPFYYSVYENTFVFGSEMKSLFAYDVPRIIDWEVLDFYLCFSFVPSPNTFFNSVYQLKPGHSIVLEDEQVRTVQYWDVVFPPELDMRTDEEKILMDFEQLFHDAVRIRMRSDVAFGAFLSGGLDSSSIVAAMTKYSNGPVTTCTIGFGDEDNDERYLAKLVADRFGTDHLERLVMPENANSMIKKLAWHYDQPFGDSSAIPTYIVSKVARERVKMILTGDGGDEVLSGYTIHQGEKFSGQFACLPSLMRTQMIPASLKYLRLLSTGRIRRELLRAERVIHAANLNFVDRLEAKGFGFTRFERSRLIRREIVTRPAREFIEDAIKPVGNRSNYTKLNYWLMKVSLPDNMLCKVDRASMANGLEARIPFLDYRIIELLAAVNMKIKLKGYQRKNILRKTMGQQLPKPLLSASKRGFALPVGWWLKDEEFSILGQKVGQCNYPEILSKGAVQEIVRSHQVGRSYSTNALWTLWMLSNAL